MPAKPDLIEVFRTAYELGHSHGWNAHKYAAKLAAKALAEGEAEECEFWKAVEASLKPRRGENRGKSSVSSKELVVPAKAGTQGQATEILDSRLRGNDEKR